MEEYGSLEWRVRRLEREAGVQRRELDLLRQRLGPSGGAPSGAGRGTGVPGGRGVGFDAFETGPGSTGGEPSGIPVASRAGADAGQDRGQDRASMGVAAAGPEGAFAASADDRVGRGVTGRSWPLAGNLSLVRGWEWWLNKVGIALLLFGVAFLFKFSWDREWLQALLTPWVRVVLGAGLGCALILSGLRVHERRGYAAVLLGGGIGTLYITLFAAYGVLDLIPHAAAFAAMVGVTGLAFALSVWQDEVVLSLVATVGGFATPFVLYTAEGSVGGLVFYASVILAGTAAIYLYRGWRSLLAVSAVGVWSVLYATVLPLEYGDPRGGTAWAVQAGVAFAWLTLWLVPAARAVLRGGEPDGQSLSERERLARSRGEGSPRRGAGLAYALSFGTPLLALAFMGRIWALDEPTLGYGALAVAGVYAGAALLFRSVERNGNLAYVWGLVAVMLATVGVVAVFDGDPLFAALALEAAALHLVARRFADRIVRWGALALFGVVYSWLVYRLLGGLLDGLLAPPGELTEPFSVDGLMDLAVIALSALLARGEPRRVVAEIYRFAACGALSLWLAGELLWLHGGASLLVLAWTLYAVAMFILSRRSGSLALVVSTQVQLVLLGTLLLGRLLYTVGSGPEGIAFLNLAGMTDLLAIAVVGGFSGFLAHRGLSVAYRVVAHGMLLAWFWGQLASLPSGDAYVTIAWGLTGAALLLVGLRVPVSDLVRLGLGTLFLVVGKLFLWDLAWVEAIWRVLLFLGFGGLFLLLSYYLPALWRGGDGEGGMPRSWSAPR